MHVYLGMSKVLGGLPDSLKARSVEEDPFKAAADLRGLLRGRVQSMLARAEEAGALVGDKNTCAVLYACDSCEQMMSGVFCEVWRMLGYDKAGVCLRARILPGRVANR